MKRFIDARVVLTLLVCLGFGSPIVSAQSQSATPPNQNSVVLTVTPPRIRQSDAITVTWSIPSDQFSSGQMGPYLCEATAPVLSKSCGDRDKVYACLDGCFPMLDPTNPTAFSDFSIKAPSGSATLPASAWQLATFALGLDPSEMLELEVVLVFNRLSTVSSARVIRSNPFTVSPIPMTVTVTPSEVHLSDAITINWDAPPESLQGGGFGQLCLQGKGQPDKGCFGQWIDARPRGSLTVPLPQILKQDPTVYDKTFEVVYTLTNPRLFLSIDATSNPFKVIKGGTEPPPPSPGLTPEQNAPTDQAPPRNASDHDASVQGATDPVEVQRGEFVLTRQDLVAARRGPDIDLTFTYSSRRAADGPFGYGWDFSYHRRLQRRSPQAVVLLRGNNRRDVFAETAGPLGSDYRAPAGIYDLLTKRLAPSNPEKTYDLENTHGDDEFYGDTGLLTRLNDRADRELRFTYDPAGRLPTPGADGKDARLIRIADGAGPSVDLTYTPAGRLDTLTYAGRTITYQYDPATGDLLSVTTPPTPEFPQGLTTRYAYINHNLTAITDPKGQTYLTNVYDPATDRVTQQTYGSGTSKLTYGKDAAGNPTTEVTDRRGTRLRFTFDPAGHITRTERFTDGNPPDEPKSYVTSYEYNAAGERTREVFPRGNATEFTYDDKGNLLEVRRKKLGVAKGVADPSDLVTRFTYEPDFHLLKTLTDPRGAVTTYTYDYELREPAHGKLRRLTAPTVEGVTPLTTFTYNAFGQVETVTDPTGIITKSTYDPATGYLLSTAEGVGSGLAGTTRFTTDAVGNVTSTTDPTGARTTFAYNALNQLTTATVPGGLATVYAYDANGNLTQADRQAKDNKPGPRPTLGTASPTDDWQTTRYGYTTLDQLASLSDDLSQTTQFGYDANGNRTRLTDPKQQLTQSVYDERNLLWKTLDAATPSGVTESRYDPNGNLVSLTDAKGNPTSYAYDDFDRLTKTTYADGAFATYEYDAASNLSKIRNPKSEMIQFTYDALNRLREKVTPDGKTTYTYDAAGRLLTATNPTGTLTFTYDTRGRVKTVTQQSSSATSPLRHLVTTYAYDAAGNRTRLTHPDGFTVVSWYDALHRLIGLDFGGGAEPLPVPSPQPSPSPAPMLTFGYDALSRRTSLSRPNGVVTRSGYDAVNRLLSLTTTRGKTTLLSLAFTYDVLGNRLSQKADSATLPLSHFATYAYDPLSQLTSVEQGTTKTSYAYDPVGNRVTAAGQAYVPNRLNQYDAIGPTTLRHDPNGNLTFDGRYTYDYDAEHRLRRVTARGLVASYTYDALSRRTAKTVNGLTTQFLYDGDQLIADYDAAGKLLARYVYGPGLDEPLVMLKAGKAYYFHADALGSIIALTDARGQLIERYTYDVFGTPTILDPAGNVRSTSVVGNRFLFTGREYDFETGLYHVRARTYDPRLGRFLQREPDPTDLNVYRYTFNNPVNWTDPLGLNVFSPTPPAVTEKGVRSCNHTSTLLEWRHGPTVAH